MLINDRIFSFKKNAMRLRNCNSGNEYTTIKRHKDMPLYFNTSDLVLKVRIDDKIVKMVLNPNETSNRVNFSLKNGEYYFIDNQILWDEVKQKCELNFKVVHQKRHRKSRENERKLTPGFENFEKLGDCRCPTTYDFKNLEDLDEACKRKVECDNASFPHESVYLPNPVFDRNPSYVLVALEPSISLDPIAHDVTLDQFKQYVERCGFKNFMRSNKSYILRYCMRKFLGDAHITDFSKGAMPPTIAGKYRTDRFHRWLPILKAELELFKTPKVYALGNEAAKYLKKFNIPFQKICKNGGFNNLLHPSPQNNGRFARYYRDHSQRKEIPSIKTFKSFAEQLMEKQGFSEDLRDQIAKNLFQSERDSDKGVFLYYRDKFKEISGSST